MENPFSEAIAQLKTVTVNEGDYYGTDGLLYCGKCHEPKQYRGSQLVQETFGIVRRPCKCDREAQAAFEKKEAETALEIRRSKADASGEFPYSYAQYTFERDKSPDSEIGKKARIYVENFKDVSEKGLGLYLYNPECDTGKTFYASCIANAIFDKGYTVLIDTYANICERLADFSEDKERMIHLLRNAALVVLDEFGGERKTEYIQQKGLTVINERVSAKKPLIITSNIPLNETENGDMQARRIYSRLKGAVTPLFVPKGTRTREKIGEDKESYLNKLFGGK